MQVGDFGCGDAFIYQQVKNHTIYSYDLISKHDYVIECDIAHVYSESRTESEQVPKENASLDICIYCLSLMGTNWSEFIIEANRLLKQNGELWVQNDEEETKNQIAEVRSRFEIPAIGGDRGFVSIIESLGFKLFSKVQDSIEIFSTQDLNSEYFGVFYFKKVKDLTPSKKKKSIPSLKPCIYKKR